MSYASELEDGKLLREMEVSETMLNKRKTFSSLNFVPFQTYQPN